MKRLTSERRNGIKTGYWSPAKKEELVQRLAEYENTGFTPERILELNDFIGSQTAKLLEELQKEREKHRWIPVSERLPEDNVSVLVQISGKPQDNVTLINCLKIAELDAESGWIIDEWPEWEGVEPDAWMPLPELYQPAVDPMEICYRCMYVLTDGWEEKCKICPKNPKRQQDAQQADWSEHLRNRFERMV